MRAGGRLLLLASAALMAACGRSGGSGDADALVLQGHDLSRQYGCISCHSADGTKSTGPTWMGLYTSKVELSDGTTVTAGEAYLRESILQPSAKTVKGFPEGLMETTIEANSVPEKDLRALIAYIKSLR